jgi:hypothetical protein
LRIFINLSVVINKQENFLSLFASSSPFSLWIIGKHCCNLRRFLTDQKRSAKKFNRLPSMKIALRFRFPCEQRKKIIFLWPTILGSELTNVLMAPKVAWEFSRICAKQLVKLSQMHKSNLRSEAKNRNSKWIGSVFSPLYLSHSLSRQLHNLLNNVLAVWVNFFYFLRCADSISGHLTGISFGLVKIVKLFRVRLETDFMT